MALCGQVQACASEEESAATLELAFAGKRTSTLRGRLGSLLQFERWAATRGEAGPWPLSEPLAFAYALHLLRERAPATRLPRFREAVAFGKGLAGLRGADEVLQSSRVAGAAQLSFDTKRLLLKRDVLLVPWVRIFEALVALSEDLQLRVFAGFVLFVMYTRARWADASWVHQEPVLDMPDARSGPAYVEAPTARTKTSNLPGKRRRALCLAGPARGLTGECWAAQWLAARHEAGLLVSETSPLMPVPLADGAWSNRPMRTDEGAAWMREVLAQYGVPTDRLRNVGTHSLKATCLSWAAKSGVASEHRRLLGYHTAPGDRSVLEYSRDELAVPMRELEGVIEAIRLGRFDPDASRSGRWLPSAVPDPPSAAPAAADSDDRASVAAALDDIPGLQAVLSDAELGALPSGVPSTPSGLLVPSTPSAAAPERADGAASTTVAGEGSEVSDGEASSSSSATGTGSSSSRSSSSECNAAPARPPGVPRPLLASDRGLRAGEAEDLGGPEVRLAQHPLLGTWHRVREAAPSEGRQVLGCGRPLEPCFRERPVGQVRPGDRLCSVCFAEAKRRWPSATPCAGGDSATGPPLPKRGRRDA